jgi:hypothetical protein
MWGHHYRSGDITESGKVTSLEEADSVEILVDQGLIPPQPQPKSQTQVEVDYVIGTERFKIQVRKGFTVDDLQNRLAFVHKGRTIAGIASEFFQIAGEDSVEDWLQRTAGIPLQVMVAKTVHVAIEFRGAQTHFAVL